MTQKFTNNILNMIHPFPCYIIYSHVQTDCSIAIKIERQQFCAVTVSLESVFLSFFFKKPKKTKIWTFEVLKVFFLFKSY